MNKITTILITLMFCINISIGQVDENSYSIDSNINITCKKIYNSKIIQTELKFDTTIWSVKNSALVDYNSSKYTFLYYKFSKKDKKRLKRKGYDSHTIQKYLDFVKKEADSTTSFQYFPKYKLAILKDETEDSLTILSYFIRINNDFGLQLMVTQIPFREKGIIQNKILKELFKLKVSTTENSKNIIFKKRKKIGELIKNK